MVVVQCIRTTWSKPSRGRRATTAWAAVPEAAPLGDVPDHGPCALQILVADEQFDFQLTGVSETLPGLPIVLEGVRVDREGGALRVTRVAGRSGVWPHRGLPARSFLLAPGQTGRVVWNQRRSGSDDGFYEKAVTNIAEVEWLTIDLFTAHAPDALLDDRTPLV